MNATKKHAPKDVTERRDGSYVCGRCGREAVRYSTPRARWFHADEVPACEPM